MIQRVFFFGLLLSVCSLGAQSLNIPSISSSSFQSNGTEKNPPSYAMDGRLNSSWVEGSGKDGIGESITINYKNDIDFRTIAIYNGFGDPKRWSQNNRIKRLRLSTDTGLEETINLKDTLSAQKIQLKSGINAKSITLTILEVYKGKSAKSTSIAEVKLLATEEGSILTPPKNTWAIGKWKTPSNVAKISLHNDGTCEMGYETAKMLCTWTEKGDLVQVQLEDVLPLTNTDKLEIRKSKNGKSNTFEINGKFEFVKSEEA